MDKSIAKKALTNWDKAEISLNNYRNYLNRKTEKFQLTIVDLLYISNFKGGNAAIHEEDGLLNDKLKNYSNIIVEIDKTFKNQTLRQINNPEIEGLFYHIKKIILLSQTKNTAIDGFKVSYLSALLHAFFPDLIPILDRRLLINLELVNKADLQKSRQVIKIERFYPALIEKIREICKSNNQTIRQIDKKYFIRRLPDWALKDYDADEVIIVP